MNVAQYSHCCWANAGILLPASHGFWFIHNVSLTFTKTEQSAVQEKSHARAFHIDCEGSGFASDCYLRDVTDF